MQQRQQVVLRPHRPQLLPPPQLPIATLQSRRRPMPDLPRRQMTRSFAQHFSTPVTRRPSRQAHNPPRSFPTFRQTARIQQPPRRRKSRRPNVPPVLPQQVKRAQLMRRLHAIHQLNPRRDGPIAIADQRRWMLRPQLPGPVNYFGPGTESPQRRPRSSADCLQFGAPGGFASTARPVPASRPAATPVPSKAPSAATGRPYS